MKHICPFNYAVDCDSTKCDSCGWNPKVAKRRSENIKRGRNPMSKEKMYKIPFTGYCEVWAESPEEAADKAEDIEKQFFAHYDYGDPECLEKEEKDEVD